jgi:nitroreductase
MDLLEAIKTRKSVRVFKPDPVPKSVLEGILQTAIHSPSAANIQPWEFVVVTGETLNKLAQANLDKLSSGEAGGWDLRKGAGRAPIPETYLKRMASIQAQRQMQWKTPEEEQAYRAERMKLGSRYFNAPAVIIITMEKALGDTHFFDIGIVSQTICLAALEHGLGTCMQGQGVMYPKMMREILGIPESKHLVIAIAIGYPDWTSPVNHIRTQREPVENITQWLGFKE